MGPVCFFNYPSRLQGQADTGHQPQNVRMVAGANADYSLTLSRGLDLIAQDMHNNKTFEQYYGDAKAQQLPTFGYGMGTEPPNSRNFSGVGSSDFRCQIWDTSYATQDRTPTGEPIPHMITSNIQWPEKGSDLADYMPYDANFGAFGNFRVIYRLLKDEFGRDSLNGKGMPILGFTNFSRPVSLVYRSAFWSQDLERMYFGQALDRSLDVCGHGLMHGVLGYCLPTLGWEGEAGALNESIADCFASMVKQYAPKILGKSDPQTIDSADWRIELPLTSYSETELLRNLKNPAEAGHPDSMSSSSYQNMLQPKSNIVSDSPGIHANCSVPSHAFYLACVALKDVHRYSWERIGQVWYHTVTDGGLVANAPNLKFVDFASETVKVAKKLYPTEPQVAGVIVGAWKQVGISV